MSPEERAAVALALGRILRLASRPAEPGDAEEYERCRRMIVDIAPEGAPGWSPEWARDRLHGAAGDTRPTRPAEIPESRRQREPGTSLSATRHVGQSIGYLVRSSSVNT